MVDVVVLVVVVDVVVVDVEVGKVIVISSIVVKLNDEKSCSYKKMSNGSKYMLSTSLKWYVTGRPLGDQNAHLQNRNRFRQHFHLNYSYCAFVC